MVYICITFEFLIFGSESFTYDIKTTLNLKWGLKGPNNLTKVSANRQDSIHPQVCHDPKGLTSFPTTMCPWP